MRLAYYPGCVSKSSGREMDLSTRSVCSALGITLEELEDWNCCGATHVANELIATDLAVRNISQTSLPIMTSCSICYSNLRSAMQRLEDPNIKSKLNTILTKDQERREIRHALEVILEVLQKNSDILAVPLKDLKVAPYYGCLMTRPKGVDSPEFPTILEELIKILKADPLELRLKTFCCGGPIFMPQEQAAGILSFMILNEAKKAGAEVMVTLCPLCHFMLDANQRNLELKYGENLSLPVLYITQLVGIALGLGPVELGLELNSISPLSIVEKIYERRAAD
jgi:heterodisulfide reductase subunit B2